MYKICKEEVKQWRKEKIEWGGSERKKNDIGWRKGEEDEIKKDEMKKMRGNEDW